ncbi:hypothetical protein [Anabaena subtropica]|uniref:Uncharacterized protein n=1 Tax=Anabaena subtropica FACHB-260 TaxID=2692884 RepID=A0ABR8CLR0_9NOST|nr:hypothetical protein [Anabaena subtropica]MBD2344176.1 hypothetical protein [Anabaena subtropica FACHB-260]
MNKTDLVLSLAYLIGQILNGDMDDPQTLSKTLQGITDRAWEECEKLVPPSLRIDP